MLISKHVNNKVRMKPPIYSPTCVCKRGLGTLLACEHSRFFSLLAAGDVSRGSLPADVLWGSFVTHSFLPNGPWGRNECVTNEPQRTSAGRLFARRTSATQPKKFHTGDVKSVRNPVIKAHWKTE